jgi:aldose 1-epimerase
VTAVVVGSTPPSGAQHGLRHGDQRATVVEVGGGVREYAVGDRDVLERYDVAVMSDGAHGAVLVPWPNRLADGRYTFDGVEHRLPVTEPATGCAIHGLLRWASWQADRHDDSSVTMSARLHPQPGYPFDLLVEVTYALDDGGLTVTTRATNVGDRPCPYGSGQHPYLSAGGGTLDACTAVVPAATRIVTDPDRQLPTGTEAVAGSPYDLRGGGSLAGLRLDDGFTDLVRDGGGVARARLTGGDGRTSELWVGPQYGYLQAFTGETLAPSRRRTALAMEPMTCPANAFNDGVGLQRLEPAATTSATWGARLMP